VLKTTATEVKRRYRRGLRARAAQAKQPSAITASSRLASQHRAASTAIGEPPPGAANTSRAPCGPSW